MRVLLTGATGFLGKRVLPLLSRHDVLCPTRRPETLARAQHIRHLRADLSDPASWDHQLRLFAPEVCIHLAWEGLPDYSPERCRANFDTSARLFNALASGRVGRVVVAGSCWEYGEARGSVAEHQPAINPGTFASTKRSLHELLQSLAGKGGFEYQWARIFFVYGAGQRETSLLPSVRAAYATGTAPQVREPETANDFIHVDDAAAGLVALAEADIASGAYNLGTGVATPVGDVVNRVAASFGKPRPFATPRTSKGFWADMSKTFATGWRPRLDIDEGVTRVLAELEAHA